MPRQLLRSPLRCWLLASMIAVGPLALAATAYGQTGQRRVLVLYSTRRDGQFSIIGERDLPRILEAGRDHNLDYYAEFVDLARAPEPDYRMAFSDFLRQKYQGLRF